jgi:hypothetical protein
MAVQVGHNPVIIAAQGQLNYAKIGQLSVLVAVTFPVVNVVQETAAPVYPMPCPMPNACALALAQHTNQARRVEWPGKPDLSVMPYMGVEYRKQESILTPAVASWDVAVVDFTVPNTYDGVIYAVQCGYGGTGFIDASGDLVWRLRAGNAYLQGYGAITTQLGDVAQPLQLTEYVRIHAGQRVLFTVRTYNLSGNIQVGTAYVTATVQGWLYPVGHADVVPAWRKSLPHTRRAVHAVRTQKGKA